ncbi:MAG: MarR family transcriptional regulator [Syntrophomonadaceae bacterium]|nr:MarR family transcriptional regulator [Syntrophomonadaceae bacterium]
MKAGGQLKGEEEFFTFREYMKKEEDLLTASMEDYLEMVYRLSRESGFTRVNELAAALNVQPPSASKMIQKMSDQGLVDYEKYGYVVLTSKGQQMGGELLYRHQLVEEFLIILGVSKGLLEQIEKIEHTLSDHTLFFLDKLIRFLKERPGLIDDYHKFINSVKAGE